MGTINALHILLTGLSVMISQCLDRYSRCTGTMFWPLMKFDRTGVSLIATIYVNGAKPESREVILDGNRRTVWHCGCWVITESRFDWISWPEERLPGVPSKSEGIMLPVYVQDHALRQLCQRMNFKTEQSIGIGHNCLGWSLRDPVILPASEGRYLIGFKYCDETAGYFIAKRTGDCIVITTFLFLTMQGTPQSQKLRERLKIGRQTVEYLQLDRLETFRNPDIRNDQELVAIFSECDCGHLFEIAEKEPEDTAFVPDHAALYRRVFFPQNAVVDKPQAESDAVLSQMLDALLYKKK